LTSYFIVNFQKISSISGLLLQMLEELLVTLYGMMKHQLTQRPGHLASQRIVKKAWKLASILESTAPNCMARDAILPSYSFADCQSTTTIVCKLEFQEDSLSDILTLIKDPE
jgi:hypothetical protein